MGPVIVPPSPTDLAPEKSAFFKAILNTIADPVFVKDDQHRWVLLNDAYCEFFGAKREDLIGKSDYDFFPGEQAKTFWAMDLAVLESGRTNENEELFTDRYGVTHTIVTRKSRYQNGDGRLFLVGTIRDVSGKKEAEAHRLNLALEHRARLEAERERKQTEESNARLHSILEALPVGVFVLDREGKVIESNAAANFIWTGGHTHFSGVSEHSIHQDWSPDRGGPLIPGDWAGVTAIRRAQAVLGEVADIRRRDGSNGTILISAVPLHDARGAINGAVVTNSDITQLRQLEVELRAAKETAEAASRLKSEFLDIAAHELRTPLTPLLALLENGIEQVTQNGRIPIEQLQKALKQVFRLNGLVDDLLDASRLEHGRLVLRLVETDLNGIVRECVSEFQARAPGRKIGCETPAGAVWITADPDRIYHVLSNLLDNAIRYTPERSPIEVVVTVLNGQVKVEVTDHGAGIAPEQQKNLFTRFYRANGEQMLRHPGLGLGLYICSQLVALHHGEVGVRSAPGQGSSFFMVLPRKGAKVA